MSEDYKFTGYGVISGGSSVKMFLGADQQFFMGGKNAMNIGTSNTFTAGLKAEDIIQSIRDEFHENDDLPNTTNPDDWARISGKKGERIIFIRTLSKPSPTNETNLGGKAIERTVSGQYL
jgi:hypothetical protein